MTDDHKIIWFTVGFVLFGLWAAIFAFSIVFAMISILMTGLAGDGDLLGYGIIAGMFLIFVVLPAFIAWKCFKVSRRLSRARKNRFVSKQAFE